MSKSFYYALTILLIILGLGWYYQDLPRLQKNQFDKDNRRNESQFKLSQLSPVQVDGSEETFILGSEAADNFEEILQAGTNRQSIELDFADQITASEAGAPGVLVRDSRQQNVSENEIGFRAEGINQGDFTALSELQALQEMERLFPASRGSSLFPGIRVSNENSEEEDSNTDLPPIPRASPTPDNTPKDVTGQARGYTMLYLMHPRARQTVEKQLEAMFRSKVQQLYLGVLIDGTFGRDFNYLSNVVRRVARERRSLILVLYLTNGHAMRSPWPGNDAPFADIDPIDFRALMQTDTDIRNRFVDIVRPIIPVLQLNRRLNESNRNFVVPMLEDDLDDGTYLSMRRLTQSVIGNRAAFVRNPHGAFPGSTFSGLGDPIESHLPEEMDELSIRDGFSLDGIGYSLSGDGSDGRLTFEESKDLAVRASSRGIRYFGLWRHERQGLRVGEVPQPVNRRDYEVPSESDILLEIEILRAGLTEVQ